MEKQQIICYSDATNKSRLNYILNWFQIYAGVQIKLVKEQEFRMATALPRLQYAREFLQVLSYKIPATGLLHETGLTRQKVTTSEAPFRIFPVEQAGADLDFDALSAIFYLLTRMEEYGTFTPDTHGRFPSSASVLHQNLNTPWVEVWAKEILEGIRSQNTSLVYAFPRPRYTPTFDIDIAYAYSGKTFPFVLKNWFQNSKMEGRPQLMKKDPFDTYDLLMQLCTKHGFSSVWFWLLSGNLGPMDPAVAFDLPKLRLQMLAVAEKYEIGLHPSYYCSENTNQLHTEVQRFSAMAGKKAIRSRQHFIRFRFPHTYRQLYAQGIREEYSMGYPDQIGFRAGTCRPFYWYDILAENPTELKIFPFAFMDVTLKNYMALSPEMALEEVKQLWETTKLNRGALKSIWHNTSFSQVEGWAGWENFLSQTFTYISSDLLDLE